MAGRDYARFYDDDLLEALQQALREELPDYTETDPYDPFQVLLRLDAYLGHLESSRLDLVAGELAWPTMQRRTSAVALAALVGQTLAADSPATVDVLWDVRGTPGPADVMVPDLGVVRSRADADTPSVRFENVDGDQVAGALALTIIADDGGVFSAPATTTIASPWGAGAPAPNDALYYGHANLMLAELARTAAGVPDDYVARMEYGDNYFCVVAPDDGSVVVVSPGIRFAVDGLLDSTADYTGLVVRVRCKATGLSEDVQIAYASGENRITTATLLGQSSPSTEASDYEVSAAWLPFDGAAFTASGAADERTWSVPDGRYERDERVPHDSTHAWQKSVVNGVSAYWLRERVVSVGGSGQAPSSVTAAPAEGDVWVGRMSCTQGETVTETIGITTGTSFDRHRLNFGPFIEGSLSVLSVGGSTLGWEEVESFYLLDADDRGFIVEEDPAGDRYVVFGDGVTGFLPARGQDVAATYRISADQNGNVGAGTITQADAGTAFVTAIRNPRAASGWRQRDAANATGLERTRRTVPGAFRAQGRMVTADDIRQLGAQTFRTADGRAPFARVETVEHGSGYKTTNAILVGSGGAIPSASDVEEFATFAVGTTSGLQRFGGLALLNQRVVGVAFSPLTVNVDVTIQVAKRYAKLAKPIAEAALRAAVNPLATDADGAYLWYPGGTMTDAAMKAALGLAGIRGLIDVAYASPSFPVTFGPTEFPVLGTLQVTVQEV